MMCTVGDCDKKPSGRGMCSAHYTRWRRYGDPLAGKRGAPGRPLGERFWEKVNKDGPTPALRPDLGPCWVWDAFKTKKGYGFFKIDQVNHQAHRVAYELEIGKIPEDLEVDHLCANPGCVRPSHLEAVTHLENFLRSSNHMVEQIRRTHCPKGHPYSGSNLYVDPRGGRYCRKCARIKHADNRDITNARRREKARLKREKNAEGV